MKFRQLKNENGITLIELLAAISLFAILLVLSSTLIVQLAKSEEVTSESISLQQDTNVLMAEIRSQYYNGESAICFKESKELINKGKTIIKNGNHMIPINNGCISGINPNEALSIQLTTENNGESFSIETTLTAKEEFVLNLEEDKENPNDFTEGNIKECHFTNNVKFSNYVKTKNGNPGCSNYQFDQSVAFIDGVKFQNHSIIQVDRNLYVSNGLTIQPHTKVIVDNDFHMEGKLDVKGEICIKGKFHNNKQYKSEIYEASECFKPVGYHIYYVDKK